MSLNKILTVSAIAVALASGAVAKGHDQSQGADGTPGANAGSETATSAQGLGAANGGKGPSGSPGKSRDANKQ